MEIKGFVEEIDYNELQLLEVVGRGAFGVVLQARWRNDVDVAVKLIETESERRAFITELKQLSRISHPNIVRLYGACTKQPVCLVMEFAEGGSLYSVLHGKPPYPPYTAAHVVSWTLQCARGVEYLHAMKPKPLIHRDLKPPNLLLINRGTVVKICDFGTACDARTHMTNNKGSAAWMAPEVFEGSNYSEKCDVFSWGIILWEVITRCKPFDELGGSAYRVMWAVHSGKRPPLVKDCPQCLETMMTRCWSSNPVERPSMSEIVRVMTCLSKLFPGGDEPVIYSSDEIDETVCSTPATNQVQSGARMFDSDATMNLTMKDLAGEPVSLLLPATPPKPVVVEDDKRDISTPSSRRASSENLVDAGRKSDSGVPASEPTAAAATAASHVNDVSARPIPPVRRHRRTGSQGTVQVSDVQQPFIPGHHRSGSYGNAVVTTTSSSASVSTVPSSDIVLPTITGGLENDNLHQGVFGAARSVSWAHGIRPQVSGGDSVEEPNVDRHTLLEPQFMPLPPCTSCPESVEIYEKHCTLVDDYIRLQAEISQLDQRKEQLLTELRIDEREQHNRLKLEYSSLLTENEELKLLHNNLMMQAEQLKAKKTEA